MDEAVRIIKRLSNADLKFVLSSFSKPSTGRVHLLKSRVTRLASYHAVNDNNISIFDLLRELNTSYKEKASSPRASILKRSSRNSSGADIVEIRRSVVHPDVRFKPLPFYEIMDELIKPTALIWSENCDRVNNPGHCFHLTPTQVADIRKENRARKQFKVQVHVRIGLLETTSPQDDNFPPGLMVKMNETTCYVAVPTPTPLSTPVRGIPIDVTSAVYLDPTQKNVVRVTYFPHFQSYVITVHLVRACTSEDLLKKLKLNTRVEFYTKGMIQQKLRADLDNEIATTHLRVHLVCPLGKMRMTNPCRATTCQHVQCFDASIYLQLNEKSSKWICPVCNNPALFKDLAIDEYFVNVLSSDRLPSGCSEIQLMSDGGWQPAGVTQNAPVKPVASTSKFNEVDIPSSEDECEVVETRAAAVPRRAKSPLTVDLISSPSPASSSSSADSPSRSLPPKKRKQVLECIDEIILSSDSDAESMSSRATTSISPSDSESSESFPLKKRHKGYVRPTYKLSVLLRDPPPRNNLASPSSPPSSGRDTPPAPEYAINLEKSSLTTLVLRKRSCEMPEDLSAETMQLQNKPMSGEEISQSILDSIISAVVEKHEFCENFVSAVTDYARKNENYESDSEPKGKRPKPEEPFVPSILKRAKPVEQKKDTLLLPLSRPRMSVEKPRRKNLLEVVNNLLPKEPLPNPQNVLPVASFSSSSPFADIFGWGEQEVTSPFSNWVTTMNESEQLVPARDYQLPYAFDGPSSSSGGCYEDWTQPLALTRKDLDAPSTITSERMVVSESTLVLGNRAEQSSSCLPSILRKSRERK